MTYTHLQERSHYEDLYDRFTVEECRRHETPLPASALRKAEKQNLPSGQLQGLYRVMRDMEIFQVCGNRYLRREKSINEWIERDKRRDEMVENARAPSLHCPSCGQIMKCEYKHLHSDTDSDREWVEFFVHCKPCKEIRHVHENGTEVVRKPILCTKCNKEVESTTKKKKGKNYYIETCKNCGHVEETLSVLDEEKKEPTQQEIDQFEHDKKRFCLSPDQGERYKRWKDSMKRIDDEKKEHEANVEFYDKFAEVKKISIAKLEKLLAKAIKKAGYTDLHINMPANDEQIVIHFTVRDTEDDREEYTSRNTLKKTIEKALEDKNWKLLSDGVSYRLGMLSGKIRGYESEKDIQELVKSRMKKKGKAVNILPKQDFRL